MIGFRQTTLDQLSSDHTIEVNTLTGTAQLAVPIRVSPGRDTFGPNLSLSYGSRERNSPFGVGWSLFGAASIDVDTNRSLPAYQDGDDRYLYGGQELTPYRRQQGAVWLPVVEQRGEYRVQRFRATVERTFERFEKWTERATGRAHWLLFARNGVVSLFGRASDNSTRVADPADPDRRTFQWLLEAQYDPKGNSVLYRYKAEDAAGVDSTLSFETRRLRANAHLAQRYLKRVLYGNSKPLSHLNPADAANVWRFEVVFDYGEHTTAVPTPSDTPPAPAWPVRRDPFSAYRSGFDIRTYRLCRRILMFHRFPELGTSALPVGAMELKHREDPAGSVLETIRYRGYRTDLTSGITADRAAPPLSMTYAPARTGTAFESPELADNIPSGLNGGLYQWIDLRNEGLPGILHRQSGSWYFKENLGDGRFGPLEILDEVPAAVSAAFQLYDFDHDGDLNFVGLEGREAGEYTRDRATARWTGFRALRSLPRVDFANARVQWVDLNGDGHDDLIVDHLDRLVWYPSEGSEGFASPIEIAKPDVDSGGIPTLTQDRRLHTFFADMTGDGLVDMVRVDNGRVEYWPHLGRGRFGPGVVMADAPVIESFGELDSARLRFADLDGSGAADLIYIGNGEVRYWINQSGNRLGSETRLANLPYIDQLSSAHVFDFLGRGTPCLVWSTPLPTHEGRAIQYLRLTGDLPPRMLVSVANNIGQETVLSYRSSAREYLRDKATGRPWRTRLPHHSMVVETFEGVDHVGGTRMATRYEYRDGYFDSDERRFVGFALVDVFDTDLVNAPGGTPPEEVTPPSMVRGWYHTGSSNGFSDRATEFYSGDASAARLPDPALEAIDEMTTEEQLDAYRALAGLLWRQEFYVIRPDGTRAPHPLRTTEFAYSVGRIQPFEGDRDAVFAVYQSETLSREYDENPSDPRVNHELVIDRDPLGNVRQRVSIAYPRRPVGTAVLPEQRALFAELVDKTYTNLDTTNRFEVGIEIEESRYSLTGFAPGANGLFAIPLLLSQVPAAVSTALAFHEIAAGGNPQARLVGMRRNVFWDDARSAALPVDQVGAVTLLHHVERAVLPDAAVATVFGGRVTSGLLSGGGRYRQINGYWWAEDTIYRYRGGSSFYRLEEETSLGGMRQIYTFDAHFLLVTSIEDVFGNRIESVPDYQALASSRVKDANDNISETRYDPLGVSIVTAMHGQQLGSDGNPHRVGADDLTTYTDRPGPTAASVLANPANFLQNASRFLFYDLEAFGRGDGPPRTIQLERERHAHDGEGNAPSPSPIRVTVNYIDGFGRTIQTKAPAGPGPAIQRDPAGMVVLDGDNRPVLADAVERWLTSGFDVFNNKGWIVRQYEPLFSTTPDFESDQALRTYGVATRTHYDPVGRVVRQDFPNGTRTTRAYTAWETRHLDANDTVVGSDYETRRAGLPASDPEKTALAKAQAHAATPTILEMDVLGRPFRLRETGEGGAERITDTIFGISGLAERIVDPRGLTAFSYAYDMLGRTVFERSVDAGERWTLLDVHGRVIHRWDGRDVHKEFRYDENGRLTDTSVDGALGLDNLVEHVVYGDNPVVPQAELRNARGRVVQRYDDAGLVSFHRYHMDGQEAETSRSLRNGTDAHKTTVDWTTPSAVSMDATQHRTQSRYDGLGRRVAQLHPDGATWELDYAAMGHVAEVRISTADAQLQQKVIATGIDTNARGQRARLLYGNGVEVTNEYEPDTFRLSRLYARRTAGSPRDYLDVEYTYDPAGNITRWVDEVQDPGAPAPLIQGLTTSSACEFTYDPLYQLRTATGRVHQALLEHDYRDGLPHPNAIKGTRHLALNNGAAVERYTRTYAYDIAGNVQRVDHQGASQSWVTQFWISPTSNRRLPKLDINGVDVTNPESRFDGNGNTIHQPHLRSMDWNHANQLARAVIIDRSSSAQPDDAEYYVYGADGLRVRRVSERLVAGQLEVTETIYFEGCEIKRISRGAATRLLRHTSHITDGLARLATLHQWSVDQAGLETSNVGLKKLHYLLGNHLGSVSLELDEAADVISYEEYFPFGGTSFVAGTAARDVKLKEYRYSGKLRDDATGFYCYEYRYYAPFVGGWLSPDPLGPVDGPNLYWFVRNNPIRFVDPDGLQTQLLGSVDKGLSESQAIAQFNRSRGLELGIQATDLRKQGDDWVIVSYTEIDPAIRELARDLGSVEAAEIIQMVRNINLGDGPGGDGDGDGDGEEKKKEADKGDGEEDTPPGKGQGDEGDGPGAGEKGKGAGGGGKDKTGDGEKGSGKKTGSGSEGAKKGSGKKGSKDGVEGGKGTEKSDATKNSKGDEKKDGRESSQPPPGVPIGPGGIPWTPDMKLPEVLPESGTPITDPSQLHLVGKGTEGGDKRSEPGSESGSGVRPGGTKGGTPGATGSTGSTPGATGSEAGSEAGGPEGSEGGLRGGTGWLTLPSWLAAPINFIADKAAAIVDAVQVGLDVIGLIPGLGEIADGLNGLISLARGDYVGASLSFAAMIPFAGWAATAGKFGRRAVQVAEVAGDVTSAANKYGDEAASVVNATARNADEAAKAASKNADEIAGSTGKGPPSGGTATVHLRPNPNGTPHWTVEVNIPGQGKLETHQVVTKRDWSKTQVLEVKPGDFKKPPADTRVIDLPDPNAARAMQQDQLARGETGKWVKDGRGANSCATAVCEVVSAGGGPFPSNPAQAGAFLRQLFNLPP